MKVEDLIMVSVDDHIVEPPDMFERHAPAELKDKMPKLIEENGAAYWTYEAIKVPNIGLNAVVGRPREEYGMEPQLYSHMRKGCYDVDARIDDMNANGILGSLCFPSFAGPGGTTFLKAQDKKMALRVTQIYNDWHIDGWCGAHPGRFIPMAILPLWDVSLMVEEIKRVEAKGCYSVTFPDNPTALDLPSLHSDHWKPFWEVCNDLGIMINCHIGSGYFPPSPSMESPMDAWITTMPMSIANSTADWIFGRFMLDYPNLKVAMSEGGIGWVPYFLERADFTNEHHKQWTFTKFDGVKKPSDIFREHIMTCFIDDEFGLKNRHDIGVERITYECDYPHSDTVWPRSPEYLFKSIEKLKIPKEEVDQITHLNAMREWRYDPFSIHKREDCTVGALRKQAGNVDTASKSMGGKSPIFNEGNPVTFAAVMEMFGNRVAKADEKRDSEKQN
ncbi:MAG: amidohydrolase [Spongiibacteraceae bacterium]|nr:amidohydrolase [Spongiibacteraceae bacterium]